MTGAKVMTWPLHPAAELFPLMDEAGLAALADDIGANGLHESLTLYRDPKSGRDVLLDGRNRLAACTAIGVTPTTRHYEGEDPIGYVLSENVHRRHLTTGQRAALAHDVLPLYEAEAKRRRAAAPTKANLRGKESVRRSAHTSMPPQERRDPSRVRRSSADAARLAGASDRAVERFKRVADVAPDLAEQVRAGDIAVDRAERVVRDRQAEDRKVSEAKAAGRASGRALRVDLRLGDLRAVLADVDDASVDAVITDPPYPREYLPLFGDLAVLADRVLTKDGVLVVMSGQTHLPDVFGLLAGGRPYRWTCAVLTEGPGYVSHPRRIQSSWKPVLVFGGGPRVGDVVRSTGTDANAKSLHRWGQDYGAFHEIVERFTKPGHTVLDPFMGSGTTLLAAHALGRHAIGCDIDQAAVATARERLGCR